MHDTTSRNPYAASTRCGSPRTPAIVLAGALVLATAGPLAAWSDDDEHGAARDRTEVAILAGGCFWGMEDLLRDLNGVVDTDVGYASDGNDASAKPAEAVRIVFDPSRISYEDILRFYFRIHDPTTRNRQGNDRGAQYRSAIFVLDDRQREVAERVRAEVDASGFWPKPLVTEITDAGAFEVADDYHQDYLEKNPGGYTCHFVRGD